MKLGLINSAWVQAGRDTAFGIRKTKEIGFDTIDIFADPLDIDAKERRLIQRRVRPGRAADRQRRLRGRRADRLQPERPAVPRRPRAGRTSTWPTSSRRRNLLLVLGEYIWQQRGDPAGRAVGDGRRARPRRSASTRRSSAWRSPWSWSRSSCRCSTTSTSMVRFLDDVDHPAVQANIDISHLRPGRQSAARRCERLRGKVAHVHISDCDGKVHGDLPPGRGVVDFPPYLEAIKGLGIDDAAISIELEYSPEPGKDRASGWPRAYEQTAALMRAAGLRA